MPYTIYKNLWFFYKIQFGINKLLNKYNLLYYGDYIRFKKIIFNIKIPSYKHSKKWFKFNNKFNYFQYI